MSMPITDAKSRNNKKWDAANLSRFSVAIPKDLNDDFTEICSKAELTRNGVLRKLIEQFVEENK